MNWKPPPSSRPSFDDQLQQLLNNPRSIGIVLVVITILMALYTSVYIVQQAERAVVTRLGSYVRTEDPGLAFKLPFRIERAQIVKTEEIRQQAFGHIPREGEAGRLPFASGLNRSTSFSSMSSAPRNLEDESHMLTGDLNVARVEWVVQYRITDPRAYLFNTTDQDQTIRDIAQATMRQVVGDKSINSVLTTGRAEIQTEAAAIMTQILEGYGVGFGDIEVRLQNVTPPERVRPAFNEVNSAEQEKEQDINKAETERNRIIPEAKGKALQEISSAEGYAKSVINRASGDAARFEDVRQAYVTGPVVTRTRMYIEIAEELLGRMENLTIVDPALRAVLPVFMNEMKNQVQTESRASFSGILNETLLKETDPLRETSTDTKSTNRRGNQ
jgi:membrane protease subunit HflK